MKWLNMFKKFSSLFVVSSVVLTAFGDVQTDAKEIQLQEEEERREAENTLAYINRMNYAYVVMKTYHNPLAVQEQYERLSMDRIDITQIPQMECNGVSIKQLIFDMQEALHDLSVQEKDYSHYKKCQAEMEKRKRQRLWIDMLTTIPCAFANAGEVVSAAYGVQEAKGAAAAVGSNATPYKEYAVAFNATVRLVGDIIGGPVKTWMDYDTELNNMRALQDKAGFEYDKSKENNVYKANRMLLRAEDEVARRFNFSSKQIVAPDKLQRMVDVLKMRKAEVVFKQLNTPEMESHVGAFSPYWYYLGLYAFKAGDYEVAASASKKFLERNRSIVVSDSMVAEAASVEVAALMALDIRGKQKKYTDRIKELLGIIANENFDGKNIDQSYLCAQATYNYLDDADAALKILDRAIGRLQNEYEQQLIEYRNLYKNVEHPKWKEVPSETDIVRFRSLYGEILAKKKTSLLVTKLKTVIANDTTSSLEKLFYCGSVTTDVLWQEAKRDVEAIGMWYFKDDERFWVELPVSWFILGEVEPTVKLMRGNKVVSELKEHGGGRNIRANKQGVGADIVSIPFDYDGDFDGIDSAVFDFPHVSWPIKITYLPCEGYCVQSGEWAGDMISFRARSINFMDKDKDVSVVPENVEPGIRAHKKDAYSDILIPFDTGSVTVSSNFVLSICVETNRSIVVAYTNCEPKQTSIKFTIDLYNKFGAFIWYYKPKVTVGRFNGGKLILQWPQDLSENLRPDWMHFQYHVDQNVWDSAVNKYRQWRDGK